MAPGLWMWFHWLCRWLLVGQPFSQCWFCRSLSTIDLFTFKCPFSISFSFTLSLPPQQPLFSSIRLFPRYFISRLWFVNVVFSWCLLQLGLLLGCRKVTQFWANFASCCFTKSVHQLWGSFVFFNWAARGSKKGNQVELLLCLRSSLLHSFHAVVPSSLTTF